MIVVVFASPRREVSPDLSLGHVGDIGFAGEAGVAGDFLELAPEVGLGLVDQGDQRAVVGGVGRQSLGENDLVGGVDGDLAVEAGDVAIAGGLDTAVAIGEVALRLVRRWRGRRALSGTVRNLVCGAGLAITL